MITIQRIPFNGDKVEQRIRIKGLLRVLGLDVDGKEKTPYFYVIVNTAETLERTAILYLLKDNQDSICLLKNYKHIDSKRGYHLFSDGVLPKPPYLA